MESFTLTKQLVEELLNYLATRPYVEVFQLVQKIQGAAQAQAQQQAAEAAKTSPKSNGKAPLKSVAPAASNETDAT